MHILWRQKAGETRVCFVTVRAQKKKKKLIKICFIQHQPAN